MTAAKKRLQARLSSKKKEDELHKWAIDKEYSLTLHDDKPDKPDILLNPDLFKGIDNGEYIEISFVTNKDIKLIFQIFKENCLEKTKANISICKNLIESIEKKYNFNPIKSKVFVNSAKKENYDLSEIEIIFKEYIPRFDIFFITQNILGSIVCQGQLIYNQKYKIIGLINKIEGNGSNLTGAVTEFTNFNITTLESDIYLMVEISKSSYNYTQYYSPCFETTINHIKNILLKLKNEQNKHTIHIFFFCRIFFKGSSKYDINSLVTRNSSNVFDSKKSHGFKFLRKDQYSENTYYFDVYDKIDTFNYENIDLNVIIPKIYKVFRNYQKIVGKEKENIQNLNKFFYSIRNYNKNSENSINNNINNNINNSNTNYLFKQINTDKESEDIENFNNLSYTFDGFNSKECAVLDDNIFKDITDFEMGSCNKTGVFESVFFAINQIDNNKSDIKNTNPLINVILSGETFPYYCEKLADKVNSAIHEEFITLYFTMLCSKQKVKKLFKKKNEYKIKIEKNNDFNFKNDEYYDIDNISCEPPDWCQKILNFIEPSHIYKHHYNYAEQFKVSLLNYKTNNTKDVHLSENILNHKITNYNISNYLIKNLDNNGVYLEILNLNFNNINNTNPIKNISTSLINKVDTKITYDNVLEKYNIKKQICQNEDDKNKTNINEENNNDEINIKFIKNMIKFEKDIYKNCKNLKEKMQQYDNLLFNKIGNNKTNIRKISSEYEYSKKIITNDNNEDTFPIYSSDDEKTSNDYEIGEMNENDFNSFEEEENNIKIIYKKIKDNGSTTPHNASGIEYRHYSGLRDDMSNSIENSDSSLKNKEFCYSIFIHLPVPYFFEEEEKIKTKKNMNLNFILKTTKLLKSRITNNFQFIISGDEKKSKKIKYSDKFEESLTDRKSRHYLNFKVDNVTIKIEDIERNNNFFYYYYIFMNSTNGSVFSKTNLRRQKVNYKNLDEMSIDSSNEEDNYYFMGGKKITNLLNMNK